MHDEHGVDYKDYDLVFNLNPIVGDPDMYIKADEPSENLEDYKFVSKSYEK
jgi:hypothetical protein